MITIIVLVFAGVSVFAFLDGRAWTGVLCLFVAIAWAGGGLGSSDDKAQNEHQKIMAMKVAYIDQEQAESLHLQMTKRQDYTKLNEIREKHAMLNRSIECVDDLYRYKR